MATQKKPSFEITTITPLLAQSWLDDNNFNNRRLDDRRVAQIANDIKKGKWIFDGTPIRFNGGGNILDGQHRLCAVVRAQKSIDALVIHGLETESKNTIDTGKSRSISDLLHFNGHVNTSTLAAAGRLALAFKEHKGDMAAWARAKSGASYQDIIEEITGNEKIMKATQAIISLKYLKKIAGGAAPAFCYYLFMSATSQHIADAFFQYIENGNDLNAESPILLLRNTLILRESKTWQSGHRRSVYTSALFIKAWNAWRNKSPIKFLKYSMDEEFPKVSK